MATAALLHFDGDLGAVVRFIGGPHVAEHRDLVALDRKLRGIIDAETLDDLLATWSQGVPHHCNATSSEQNFQAFVRYGNLPSVSSDPEKTYQALLKDNKRGYCLIFDPRAIHFILNCHVTPQGVIDLDKPFKNPRPIFDSTFRPKPWCFAINDWTTKDTEPPIIFMTAFKEFLVYLYNLRLTYPRREIFLGDDDVSGAFRQDKYHPDLVAMHCFFLSGHLAAATGTTFGDKTSPPNYEPMARARMQLAQHLWHSPDIVEGTIPYLPLAVCPCSYGCRGEHFPTG